jgi:membrane-associated protease RseP (regulator of RpoE activity)
MRNGFTWAGAALAALVAGQASAGGPQVRVHSTTNVSAKVIVHTVAADGTQKTQVFGGGGASRAAAAASEAGALVTWLGVTTEASSDELRAQLSLGPGVGLTVFGVAPEGPAAQAGLKEHDVLVRFDDQILMDPDQLKNLVRAKKSGERAKLTFLRKGREESAEATLSEREEAEQGEAQVIQLGDISLDVESLMRDLPKFSGARSGAITHFSTNWSFGGSGGNVITIGGGDGGCDPAEVMKNLKIDDAKIRQIVEEALKAAGQAQQGSQK